MMSPIAFRVAAVPTVIVAESVQEFVANSSAAVLFVVIEPAVDAAILMEGAVIFPLIVTVAEFVPLDVGEIPVLV